MSKVGDKSDLSKRIKRYASVGKVVSGLVTKIAGEKYLGLNYDNNKHAKRLSKDLSSRTAIFELYPRASTNNSLVPDIS